MRKLIPSVLLLTCACITWAQNNSKVAADFAKIDPASNVDVIVQYRVQPNDSHFTRAHNLGAKDKYHFTHLPATAYTIPVSAVASLAADPDVLHVSVDHKLRSHLDISAKTINATLLWAQGYTGSGVGVAVIDSGINSTVQDLGDPKGQTDPAHSRVIFKENFLVSATNPNGAPNPQRYQTADGYGHGTHVAGIIAGNGFMSSGPSFLTTFKGIAPTANLIDFQVLDSTGAGTDSSVIAALEEAINLKNTLNIRVVNMSLGRPVYESFAVDPLCQAAEAAWKAGIVVVVAAGNDGRDNTFGENGYGTIDAPGNDPYVITVGAMNSKYTSFRNDDVITTYTSKGPTAVDHFVKPDVMAPGNHISSLLDNNAYLPQTYPSDVVNSLVYQSRIGPSNYLILNGTSMATGVVSGAAADLLNVNPSLTPDQIKATLMLTASKTFYTYSNTYYNLAEQSYGTNAQLQQAMTQLAQAQAQLNAATNQVTQAQQQITQTATQVQTATANYNAALTAVAPAAAAVTTAQANLTSASAALATANTDLIAANAALQTAQAAQQSAQQAVNAASTANKGSAQSALVQAQNNVKSAQKAQSLAQTAFSNAQNTVNQAQAALTQAQKTLTSANSQVQTMQNQLSQAKTASAAAAQALTTAQAALQTLSQNIASLQNQVDALEIPNASMQAQLEQMQSDPTQYTGTQYDIFTVGAGLIDLNAALQNVNAAPSNTIALSPVAYVDSVSGDVVVSANYAGLCNSSASFSGAALCETPLSSLQPIWDFTDSSWQSVWDAKSVWGAQSVWDAKSVWGAASFVASDKSVWGAQTIWGAKSVWGASATQAFKSVWGASSVWGSSSTSANNADFAESVIANGDHD